MPQRARPAASISKADILRIGRKDATLARTLDARSRALFVGAKTAERGELDEAGHVLLGPYDYMHGKSLIAVVDTKRKTVVTVRETDAQFQLSDKEREAAERIAGEDRRVRSRLAGRKMNALTRLCFPPRERAPSNHRHAIVFLRPNKSERAVRDRGLDGGRHCGRR